MLSTDFTTLQDHIHLLKQNFPLTNIPAELQAFLPEFSAQFQFDPLDMSSLPALMSPGSSIKEFSESADGREEEEDDDEDLDEYEIFATPRHRTNTTTTNNNSSNNKQYQLECPSDKTISSFGHLKSSHPMVLERAFPSYQPQQSQFPLPNTTGPMYSEFQQPQMMYHPQQHLHQQQHPLIPKSQRLQTHPHQQQQQQQQPMYTSYIQQPFLPSSTPLHPAVPTISVEQVANTHTFVDSNILDYYLSSLESQHQHRQQPAQKPSLLATFESSLDLLMAPHMVNGSNTGDSMSNGSFTQSPTMSWASVESSRPSSPEQQLATPNHVVSHNKRPRPTRKHSVPMHRKAKFIASSDRRTTTTSNDNVIADEVISKTTAETDNSNRKRKRRARQTKPKVKPTSFSCDVPDCGKVFSRAYNLTSHMKTHSAERPFVCGSCPLAFARRHDRERHVRLHTGEE
ncbi:Metallothionein expression activator [Mortierella sp. GBA35]|nr:Metallothionein expression activator [Mortierella sp. GBA35]